MNIIFVRHGESEHNAGITLGENAVLTKKGREQAKALGNRLKKYNISTIYTSNLNRAKETGEIISKILKVPIKENLEELDEYPSEHLKSRLHYLFNIKTKRRFRGLRSFLKNIAKERNEDKTVLIVAHGITNRIIVGCLLKIPFGRHLLGFVQDNTCINIVLWKEKFNNWSIQCLNDTKHLSEELKDNKI